MDHDRERFLMASAEQQLVRAAAMWGLTWAQWVAACERPDVFASATIVRLYGRPRAFHAFGGLHSLN